MRQDTEKALLAKKKSKDSLHAKALTDGELKKLVRYVDLLVRINQRLIKEKGENEPIRDRSEHIPSKT